MILVKRILKLTVHQLLCIGFCFFVVIAILSLDLKPTCNIEKKCFEYPVILWWTKGFPGSSEDIKCLENLKCSVLSDKDANCSEVNAYLFYGSNINFEDLPLPRRSHDIWGLYHEESPRNVAELSHEHILNGFNFSSTLSRYSDVPFPLQYLDSLEDITSTKYFVETKEKNNLLNEISAIMYLQTDCETATERDEYVKELMKFIPIDSYGACLNNKALPERFTKDYLNNLNEDEFLKFIARYKFVIAIENGVCEDYVTEKFWRAIKVGSVPIYFGSPSIRDWFPNNKSAILLDEFPTPQLLSNHLELLLKNDDLYEEYLDHKTIQIVSNRRITEELISHPYQTDPLQTIQKFECFVCQKLHNIMNGKSDVHIVNKKHYDCPKPISALTLQVNPSNYWVSTWEIAKTKAENIYKNVISKNIYIP